ncbi:hypothetical protein [Actinoplanes couchii]|uniref:Uncharacterized protein n=1 Tax=Actinoplanes couchii TaxID=403638 RepID=A0ABQ3XCY6_9ACTN|nr:hypothetical protein [Actinoplanes couchii]MDR6321252.1 hypothetical protein [Actinoplanes couchii]GID56361.1 hypothetical protein Aco03nite_047650 [Actinoplanes couchii]
MEQHAAALSTPRARGRAARWITTLAGLLSTGRTPAGGLPAWITEPVGYQDRFSGRTSKSDRLSETEIDYARRHRLPANRRQIFKHAVDPTRIGVLLDEPHRLRRPEQSALPILAWLLAANDDLPALLLLGEIGPYRHRLDFLPAPVTEPGRFPELVWIDAAGDVTGSVRYHAPQPRVAAMNDTLRIWNLFADRVLEHWLESGVPADREWLARSRDLLAEHADLARKHPPSRRHAGPKANLTVLISALDDVLAGREPRTGLVHTVTTAMVRRRGAPGSPAHRGLRARQAADAARLPRNEALGRIADRMAALPGETGAVDVSDLLGTTPEPMATRVRRAGAVAPDSGLFPSGDALARIAPRIAAEAVAAGYPDPRLRELVTDAYLAFHRQRSRRPELERRIRFDELPWIRAVAGHRTGDATTRTVVARTLSRLGTLTLRDLPDVLVPDPLVRELAVLSREAGLDLPWVLDSRIPAPAATELAAELLAGTLYDRYYQAGYVTAEPWPDEVTNERAQTLTTHNLATLWEAGAELPPAAARRCFDRAARLSRRLGGPNTPRLARDIAIAWRHMIFHLSLDGDPEPFVLELPVGGPLGVAVTGLRAVLAGDHTEPLTSSRLCS